MSGKVIFTFESHVANITEPRLLASMSDFMSLQSLWGINRRLQGEEAVCTYTIY